MPTTIPHRAATPEELADHDVRLERAKRWDRAKASAELVALAVKDVRRANCPQCWQRPGRPCTVTGASGDHLARWQRAERRGLITRAELAVAVATLDVIAPHAIIRDRAL